MTGDNERFRFWFGIVTMLVGAAAALPLRGQSIAVLPLSFGFIGAGLAFVSMVRHTLWLRIRAASFDLKLSPLTSPSGERGDEGERSSEFFLRPLESFELVLPPRLSRVAYSVNEQAVTLQLLLLDSDALVTPRLTLVPGPTRSPVEIVLSLDNSVRIVFQVEMSKTKGIATDATISDLRLPRELFTDPKRRMKASFNVRRDRDT